MAYLVTVMKFVAATLLPVGATWVFYRYERSHTFDASQKLRWQFAMGIVFGCIAMFGTEVGFNVYGATVNVRDAAPITAGLIFGGPAGIIAGLLGGIERWFAVRWGAGVFTQYACTGATILAGYYAAFLHEFMFERHRPPWTFGFVIGVVAEVLHLTMILLSNASTPQVAYNVVRIASGPLIICNSISIVLSLIVATVLDGERLYDLDPEKIKISQAIQNGMLPAIGVAFVLTTGITTLVQINLSNTTTRDVLKLNVKDVIEEISEASDVNLAEYAMTFTDVVPSVTGVTNEDLKRYVNEGVVAEISTINEKGIIVASSNDEYVGFDMTTGEQSKEFVDLINNDDLTTYVQQYQPITYDSTIWRKYAATKIDGGIVQVGLDADQFQKTLSIIANDAAAYRHIGERGYLLILNNDNEVVGISNQMSTSNVTVTNLIKSLEEHEPNVVFTYTYVNEPCYCLYDKTEGFSVVAFLPSSEANFSRNVALLVSSFMEVIVFALLFGVIYFLVKRLVVNGIRHVNDQLDEITDGNLGIVVDARDNEELASLSVGINSTVDVLKRYISDAEARIDRELEYASLIQQSALPSVFPPYPSHTDFEIYALMRAAKEVGGDFYDFYLMDDDHLVFLVADVSGKSIPGAMFMMRAKTVIKSYLEAGLPVNEVFTQTNKQLCEGNTTSMFVTSWLGLIDLSTGHVQVVNAGHNPPALSRSGQRFNLLVFKPNIILGCMDDVTYRLHEFDMCPGDVLYLYTDGVTEANDESERQFTEERLLSSLDEKVGMAMDDLCKGVLHDVDAFVGKAEQFDDITMLALKFIGRIVKEMTLPATLDSVEPMTAFIDEELEKIDCPLRTQMQIDVAIDEVLANICSYAYDAPGGSITLRYEELDEPHAIRLTFIDKGKPFNPLSVAAPDTTLGINERKIGGLGIFIVRKTMDHVYYEYRDGENVFQVTKNLA